MLSWTHMRPNPGWLVAAILLVGFALRTAPLTQNRFHPDEALYATFGRLIASGRDPLLSTIVVDKPPLPFYLIAASLTAFGGTEFAARLPSLFASTLTVALLYQLARTFYGWQTAPTAALALAASPMAISFANTLFTDNFLATFLILVLLRAVRRQWAAAGWAFGLAFACKQSALFFLPLVAMIGVVTYFGRTRGQAPNESMRAARTATIRFLGPVLLCALLASVWDFARNAPIAFWSQGYADNNPGRLVRSNEIWPRLRAWADLLQYPVARPGAVALVLGLPALLISSRRSLPALYDYALASFSLAFLTSYWLLAFNVWDRYLLILSPIMALLCARVLTLIAHRLALVARHALRAANQPALVGGPGCATGQGWPRASSILILLTAFCLLPPALVASQSRLPIGGDHGAYDGINEISKTLRTVRPGSVLYDHWLSWELGFYLFDGPAYIAWMPDPGALAEDLRAFGHASPRYIIAPSWESFSEMQTAIEGAGFAADIVQRAYRRDGSLSFTLYRIQPAIPGP